MPRWALTDLLCHEIGVFQQRKPGSNIIIPLSDQRRATLNVSLEEEVAHLVQPLKTALYVEDDDGKPLFHGPCLDPIFQGQAGQVTIPAVDAGLWAERGYHHSAFDVSQEQAEILWSSILARRFDLITGFALFRIIRGDVVATGTSRDHKAEAGTTTWQPLKDINQLVNGVEFELEPLKPDQMYTETLPGGARPCAAWARLNVRSRLGSDKSEDIVFNYGFGLDNAADFTYGPQGSLVKNSEDAWGQAQSGGGAQPHGVSDNPSRRLEYGTWEGWDTTQFTSDAACKAYAQQQIAAYAAPVPSFTVVPAMEWMHREGERTYGFPPAFGKEYFVGDTISAEGQLGIKRYASSGRITQATLTEVDKDLNLKVELACVPTIAAGGYT